MSETSGEWVAAENIGPACNMWMRKWMTKDRDMRGTYVGQHSIPHDAVVRGLMWWFPNDGA